MSTPARRQYLDIKAQHQDAILLYQVGDFFETFDEDAHVAARELQIALTTRSYGPSEHVPLAGVPVHALETYAARLVARGYKVAICEQTSLPGHGLVERAVTRIMTPGTVTEPGMVPARRDNYLVAVYVAPAGDRQAGARGAGLAYVDVSAGVFACTQWPGERLPDALLAELDRLDPAELLVPEPACTSNQEGDATFRTPLRPTYCPAHYFDPEDARRRLTRHFNVTTLAAFGLRHHSLAVAAAGAILAYLERMNPALLRVLASLRRYETQRLVEIDGRTWRALEATEPATPLAGTTGRGATLLSTLDATRTAMGARLLRRTLLEPLTDRTSIEMRLDALSSLYERPALRERLAALLDGLGDLERLTARVVHATATPRELHALAAGLRRVPALRAALRDVDAAALAAVRDELDTCVEAAGLIERAVQDPAAAGGHLIREGYHQPLDTLVATSTQARGWIAALETSERERTGIKSLKVGYNKVFGYYLEVSRANLGRVPPDYQRRQTLANGERFVTAELKEHEATVLHATEQIESLERQVYAEVLCALAAYQPRLRTTSAAIAQLDVWLSLATVAATHEYVRPEITETTELTIVGGRHPLVESAPDAPEFIANDLQLDTLDTQPSGARIVLLTGPNMAGKSTYLRQVASIVLLAHIGSFVPARHARIGLVDRLFTRVGAEDDLARGLSTFMLEMVETAYILRHATPRSLVILDEVGRGTSTHDGLAIARAVIEYLHDTAQARTLFATHYHELAELASELPRLRLFRMAVAQRDGRAIFLHRVEPGASSESYGVQVARMAGVPALVTERAATLLDTTQSRAVSYVAEREHPRWPSGVPGERYQSDAPAERAVREREHALTLALAGLNIAAMTPLEALNMLFSLQQQAQLALRLETG
jgi:DNA mismatch repair protein MutS